MMFCKSEMFINTCFEFFSSTHLSLSQLIVMLTSSTVSHVEFCLLKMDLLHFTVQSIKYLPPVPSKTLKFIYLFKAHFCFDT